MTHNSPHKLKPSFKATLQLYIALLVLIPMLLSSLYFSYNTYQQAINLAYDDVERSVKSLSLDLKSEIASQKFILSSFSNNRVFGEVSSNILFSQYAFNQLKSLVNDNDTIDGAFISDGSEFIIEAFPLDLLKLQHPLLIEKVNAVVNAKQDLIGAELFYLSQEQAQLNKADNGYFFIVLPLKRQLPSLVKPSENTGALFLQLNPETLLKDVGKLTDTDTDTSAIEISINGQPYFQYQWQHLDEFIVTTSQLYNQALDGLNLSISLGHKVESYTNEVFMAIGINLILILALFFIVSWFTRNFTNKLSAPIHLLEDQSQRFASGEYSPSHEDLSFAELTTLQHTLNAMANTITEQITSLKDARNKAQASEKMKARFLANMSHEIRTPLNGVIGLMKMMESERLTNNQKKWLKSAEHSAKLLLTVVNDILDFSKIEAGKVKLELLTHDINDIVDSLTSTANAQTQDKDLIFTVENRLDHQYWHYDAMRLSQILVNLTSNAIKFTEHGNVTVTIEQQNAPNTSDNKQCIVFTVTDTGIGMSKAVLEKLFTSFEQADVSTTRKFGGTGLGLAISKQLAQLMDGTLTATSEEGQGSKFTLSIPMDKAEAPQSDQSQSNVIPDLSGVDILIVEDNKINQTIIAHALKQTHANLTIVDDGQQAVDAVKASPPNAILMDVQMPVMDGVQATKLIRELDYTGLIIMQTANVLDEEVSHYLAVGANAHISKPINANELFNLLSDL